MRALTLLLLGLGTMALAACLFGVGLWMVQLVVE